MDFYEIILLIISSIVSWIFLSRWYQYIFKNTRMRQNTFPCGALCLLPALSFIIIIYTLTFLAAQDVTSSIFWIFFYVPVGFLWLSLGIFSMFAFFDLSWIDDAINMNNPAAQITIICGGLGLTLIYAGANIGNGPGWWCIFFAGGLGVISWFCLGILINCITKAFVRITVGRDILCGIRTGSYLLANGIIFGRAVAGDWTSFSRTIAEFGAGTPALLLTAIFILVELRIVKMDTLETQNSKKNIRIFSLTLAGAYLIAAICVLKNLPPLPVNPIYHH